jgi:DNA polymerase-1
LGSGWNWDSPTQVTKAFAALGITLECTDDDALAALDHPVAGLLRDYRAARKCCTTYGIDWLKHVAADGRVFAGWRQLGSEAGRMSCRQPNLQQLPRDRRYRQCFRPIPGRVLVKADYSQIELRIAAKIATEPSMLDAYRQGLDLHTLTAQHILGKAEVSKADRQLAKAINFGLLYGMGAKGFRAYAQSNYGVSMTFAEAKQYRNSFFRAYPGLVQWHAKAGRACKETRTLAGRRRLFPQPIFTQQVNTPVQGTGADGLKLALGSLWKRRHEMPGAFPVLVIHDEIVMECSAEQADTVATILKATMIEAMAPLIDPVPVEVEVHVSRTWAGD